MNAWLQLGVGLASSYLAATASEAYLHRAVGHASPRRRRFWARHRRLFGHLLRAHYRHGVVHHGLTYREDHFTQFRDDADRARVDAIVAGRGDPLIRRERYGTSIGVRGLLSYNATLLPLLPALAWACGPVACLGALPVFCLAPSLAMLVHPYLHLRRDDAIRLATGPVSLVVRSRYFRAVARHHYLHHAYPDSNFNLLLGGDCLLGTRRRASPDDLAAMEALGLIDGPGKGDAPGDRPGMMGVPEADFSPTGSENPR